MAMTNDDLAFQIIASITPKTWVALAQFTYDAVNKYKIGGAPPDMPPGYPTHIVILVSVLAAQW